MDLKRDCRILVEEQVRENNGIRQKTCPPVSVQPLCSREHLGHRIELCGREWFLLSAQESHRLAENHEIRTL